MSHTRTYAILEVSAAVYAEIRAALAKAGYADQFRDDGDGEVIDLHGIALQAHCAHVWEGRQLGGDPTDAVSTEWIEVCKLCGRENPGSSVDLTKPTIPQRTAHSASIDALVAEMPQGRNCPKCGGMMAHGRLRGWYCLRECQPW